RGARDPAGAHRRDGRDDRRARGSGAGMTRFVVGIDLGTTNSALAFVDTAEGETAAIGSFLIPQVIAPREGGARPTLPSSLSLPGASDAPAQLALPWAARPDSVAGDYARARGAEVPNRLVASAKSWLCHPVADRTAAILPWGAGEDIAKLS